MWRNNIWSDSPWSISNVDKVISYSQKKFQMTLTITKAKQNLPSMFKSDSIFLYY